MVKLVFTPSESTPGQQRFLSTVCNACFDCTLFIPHITDNIHIKPKYCTNDSLRIYSIVCCTFRSTRDRRQGFKSKKYSIKTFGPKHVASFSVIL